MESKDRAFIRSEDSLSDFKVNYQYSHLPMLGQDNWSPVEPHSLFASGFEKKATELSCYSVDEPAETNITPFDMKPIKRANTDFNVIENIFADDSFYDIDDTFDNPENEN